MNKKIAILGSTGSIGKTTLKILENKNFNIILLAANKNYKTLFKQAKKFNVKNIIITNDKSYKILKLKCKKLNIKVFNNFNSFRKIFKKKIDYTMSCITGIDGLIPTINIIKYTKQIAVANKESIICGWKLIQKELKKNKTKFIPVDSEHFSLWYGLQNLNIKNVENIFLTASGGPFYKTPINEIKNAKISQALNHPNWKMGKKISIDSATLINKVFEVIEAKNIFDISYKKISILIHPFSYLHAIIKFNNGLIKLIAHDTSMKVPIFNSLYNKTDEKIKTQKIDLKKLNNLDLNIINKKRYPMVKILENLPSQSSLYETIIVSANDALVELYLKKKIKFTDINKFLFKFIYQKKFLKYKLKTPKSVNDIIDLNQFVRLKIFEKVYKSSNV